MRTTLYFAYGSNLDPAQMRRRCPGARPVRRAYLEGYRLAFAGHSRTWGGAVATLVRNRDARTWGLLYELPEPELLVLDRYEGHPWAYRRKRLLVTQDDGRRRRAYVYVLPAEGTAAPAPGYLQVLRGAYGRLGFDLGTLAAAAAGGAR